MPNTFCNLHALLYALMFFECHAIISYSVKRMTNMKLVQALLISGLSALSISAFAAETQELGQAEAGTQQPVIVTTQADGTQDPNAAVAAQPQTEQPGAQDAAIDEDQNKQVQE